MKSVTVKVEMNDTPVVKIEAEKVRDIDGVRVFAVVVTVEGRSPVPFGTIRANEWRGLGWLVPRLIEHALGSSEAVS